MGARQDAREALVAAGLRPQKRWGQHFLCDTAVAHRIVDTAAVGPTSTVLEIGPGLGALTDELAARAGRLWLIEIDRGLAARLSERYADNDRVRIVVGDVLERPLAELVPDPDVTVVANLPYNIATEIVFRLLDARRQFPRAVLMLQREVARRFVARPGADDRSAAAVMVQTYAEVRIAFGVSRRSFLPPPKVESAVVDLRWTPEARVHVADAPLHRAVVRAAFGQRRKMLRNALAALAHERGLDAAALAVALAGVGVSGTARAETLELDDFARIAGALGA